MAASPASSRHGSKKLERMMPRGIFSSPKTSTASWRPLATAVAPRASAAPPLAQPASTFTIGTPESPSAVSTLCPAATPPYTVPQNAA